MVGIDVDIEAYLQRLAADLACIDPSQVVRLADAIYSAFLDGRSVFVFGNGGSGATASHLCEDLNKNALTADDVFSDTSRRPRVMSLNDNTSWITAIGNDLGFVHVFVQQLMHFARPGDLAIAVSGSGNSPNVLAAVRWANRSGLRTFGITGFHGGTLKAIQHDGLHVPICDMGMVESVHLAIGHWLVDDLHARVNGLGRHKT